MTSQTKDTIYIDVDDEITNIIDKVKSSEHKIVALVLPKRAATLQSVVNMKLLKKAASKSSKSLVLITSESGLLPLAGAAGLHVAKSLQSKPVIPPLPSAMGSDEAEELEDAGEPVIDKSASIGALAASASKTDDDTETIELDNMALETPAAGAPLAAKIRKLKHLKVPNFEKFRLGFFLAGLGLVLLVLGWFLAFVILPKATVAIKTDTTTLVSSFDFTASTNQPELDIANKKIPAVLKEVKKTDSEKVAATGQRDDGTKAEGKVTLTASCVTSSTTVPEGTTVSTGGLNFITQDDAAISSISGGGPGTWVCSRTVDVISAENGDKYNIGSGKTFTVSGYSNVSGTNSNGFSGGTSKIVKIVSQKDIDDAVAKINARVEAVVNDELKTLFDTESLLALTETKKTGTAKITATPAVNQEAAETTVAAETVYTMLGIQRDHLSQIIKDDVKGEIDTEKQAITDDGIDAAIMRLNNMPSPSEALVSFRTSVTAGPELDLDAIKEAIRGKKRGEAEKFISSQPGVKEVIVEYSPFWVYSTPKASKKITIVVEKTNDQPVQQSNDTEQ